MADQKERVSVWNRVKQYHGQENRKTADGETTRVNVVIDVWFLGARRYLYDFVHLGTDEERETLVGPCLGTGDRILRYLEKCVRDKKEIPYFRRGFETDWKFIDDKLDSLMEGMK